jgi:PTH1 family peptidyl-tRNA hydrolase
MTDQPARLAFRLIVGLGNPGREYTHTRHNVGFMILDRLACAAGAEFHLERGWKAQVARAGDVHLCKPQTYMNLSGEAVRAVGDFYKITPAETLVVVDDMALPLGKLRLRPNGSAGGHNGLKSLIEVLGTQDFPRLRIGIGAAQPGGAIGHVLGRFAPEERDACEESLARSLEAITMAQCLGLPAAMNAYN